MTMRIDLNCDLGEGGAFDEILMPWVTSANIACGGHAGDAATMRATVELAQRHGVAIGAHPGFADRGHFGRREISLSAAEIRQLVEEQVGALQALASVRHVKPHGALYNLAARDDRVARAVAEGVRSAGAGLILIGLAGSALLRAGTDCGLQVAGEAFADRRYGPDGALVPRDQSGALIDDVDESVEQVLMLVRDGCVRATSGALLPVKAATICVHGDTPNAVELAGALRAALTLAGIGVEALTR